MDVRAREPDQGSALAAALTPAAIVALGPLAPTRYSNVSQREEAESMSDQGYDVVIAGYATIDAAKTDFGTLVQHVQSDHIKTTEGVILVEHDYGGQVQVTDTADRHGLIGKFVKHRIDSGIESKVGQTIPEGTAGIIILVAQTETPGVKEALVGAFMCSVEPVDGDGLKDFKQGLEASAKGPGGAS